MCQCACVCVWVCVVHCTEAATSTFDSSLPLSPTQANLASNTWVCVYARARVCEYMCVCVLQGRIRSTVVSSNYETTRQECQEWVYTETQSEEGGGKENTCVCEFYVSVTRRTVVEQTSSGSSTTTSALNQLQNKYTVLTTGTSYCQPQFYYIGYYLNQKNNEIQGEVFIKYNRVGDIVHTPDMCGEKCVSAENR
eukprot:GDKI01014037.1.p1 GENE.GDKI01014037.1~~GDKI01014037.1.p1  ORF type:complete len:195 (-),score=35.70 GDKI01014037.1:263-847(-)